MLGQRRSTKIYRQADGGLARAPEDYRQEWEAFLDDFQQTLDKFKVPAEEQTELKAIVDSTRSDIVIDSALRAAS